MIPKFTKCRKKRSTKLENPPQKCNFWEAKKTILPIRNLICLKEFVFIGNKSEFQN